MWRASAVGRRPMTPALTRPTVMTVIAVLDWITPVMNVPARSPVIGVPATLASKARILTRKRLAEQITKLDQEIEAYGKSLEDNDAAEAKEPTGILGRR